MGSYHDEGYAEAAAQEVIAEMERGGWRPIATAPEDHRVIVAGWNDRKGQTAGHWWLHEDVIWEGEPLYCTGALLWHPLPDLPETPPEGAAP